MTLLEKSGGDKKILAAMVGNQLRELSYNLDSEETIRWVTLSDQDGERIYQRGLVFLFYLAMKDCFPEVGFSVVHSLSKGLYLEFHPDQALDHHHLKEVEARMRELVEQAIPFNKIETDMETARQIYAEEGLDFKNRIISYKRSKIVTLYECRGYHHYFYGYMVPDTSYLDQFELCYYAPGFVLRHPTPYHPDSIGPFEEQAKTHLVHLKAERWGDLMGIASVSDLNERIKNKGMTELMHVEESLHEKEIALIADEIIKHNKRVVLIAGPSSSGKTTFAQRLKIQLMTSGLLPQSISLDNYFVNREQTPLDEFGEYDFEAIEALDLKLLNEQLVELLDGEEVFLPKFDFVHGRRHMSRRSFSITANQPLIIEGIHGLNEILSASIFKKDKYKIYISAMTQLNLDQHNRIPTTDNRLIRRMVRDHLTRGNSAEETLKRWPSVRRGEHLHIFPYQEEADVIFNSAMVYELAVLRKYALPLLEEIRENSPVFAQAKRLKKFLYYFLDFKDEKWIPSTSILREFIGGSSLTR